MSYRFADSWLCKPVWHIPLLCVQWKTPDDGQRNCPKRVEFYSKNKFEKLVDLVGFIIRVYTYYLVINMLFGTGGRRCVTQWMANDPKQNKCENVLTHNTVLALGFSGLTFREGQTVKASKTTDWRYTRWQAEWRKETWRKLHYLSWARYASRTTEQETRVKFLVAKCQRKT